MKYKYPRTFHLPWSLGKSDDDKVLQNTDMFMGQHITVFEKMDGENNRANDRYLLHWDRKGICRAFSTIEDNLHWTVPSLKGVAENYSKVLI